jgi:hypothetical protein
MICPTPLLLDDDLIVEVEAEACRRGAPVADTLCDLLATELPDALREVLAAHVAEDRSSKRNGHRSESQPALPASVNGSAPAVHRGTLNDFLQTSSSNSIQLDVPMKGTSSDACA